MPEPGSCWVDVGPEPLDEAAVHTFLVHPNAGGTCVFVGRTRRWTGSVETTALRYEAYSDMAAAEMLALCTTACERWGSFRTVLLHRTGDLEVGQASVIVGASCAHRDHAFAAARWLIDTLKESVPIWKTDL